MKQLKITIAGEVKTFDLPENGEYKCEVEESYVPKAGDCVMIETSDHSLSYWCKLTEATNKFSAYFKIYVNSRLETSKTGCFYINKARIYTKITPEELKAKYAEAGYDWDYESDTIKPIKWVPKEGDEMWVLNAYIEPKKINFRENCDFDKNYSKKAYYSNPKRIAKNSLTIVWSLFTKKIVDNSDKHTTNNRTRDFY